MADNVNAGPSAAEIFAGYFKKSQSVIGVLNPNIFWQLYDEAVAEEEENEKEEDDGKE